MEFLTQVLPEEKTGKVWVNMDQVETVRWDEEKKTATVHFASGRMIEVREKLVGTDGTLWSVSKES